MTKERQKIPLEDRWNVEAFYPTWNVWEEKFKQVARPDTHPHWPELAQFKGRLHENADTLKSALDLLFALDRQLSSLYTYAHLRHDEDITNNSHKVTYNRILSIIHEFGQEISWLEPEILAIPEGTMNALLASPQLKEYAFHLEKLIRVKQHMLSPEMEELMALSAQALQASQKAFSAINDADFKFGTVLDGQNNERELSHGSFGLYIRDQDRVLRKNAFLKMHETYLGYENTLCELINGNVQAHLYNARARKYASCLDAALFPKNIDTAVYHALIKAVHSDLSGLHQYIKLRKNLPGVDQLHLYDMYVPLTGQVDIKIPYHEAEELVIESVAPLGADYQNLLKKGLKEQGWVDRFENKNKRSGAYSSGSYDSNPYILMNYREVLRDVFTLAHEAGHSMHSLYSHKNQPYQYGDYPIFLAEVASTFNEELLSKLLLSRTKNKEEKIYLLTQKIEDIRATLFRQTMFAEFELFIHEMAEQNVPLTPKLLKDKFQELNALYFGPDVVLDPVSQIEWARIPHFYYNFYVFQYATGISAAYALSERVLKGGQQECNDYLSFLKAGCHLYPIDTLKMAGVDMRSPEPVKAAIGKFNSLVKELSILLADQLN